MVRCLFFGLGAFVALWGSSLFVVDGVLLRADGAESSPLVRRMTSTLPDGRRMFDPPDWVGYTLVGMGGLTMLYSVALPRS